MWGKKNKIEDMVNIRIGALRQEMYEEISSLKGYYNSLLYSVLWHQYRDTGNTAYLQEYDYKRLR